MDYKLELQNNNIDLNAILESINTLPDKSGFSGGIDTSDATITSGEQLLSGVIAYGANGKITGTHVCHSDADTSDVTLISGNQLLSGITAYGASGKITGTIPSQEAKIITPTKSSQVAIASGTYASGEVTVEAIPSEYITTSDATITSGTQLLSGVTAYGTSGKITGTIPSQSAKTITPTKSSQIAIASGTYASGAVTVASIPSEYITTSDATAIAGDIADGKTAYVNGVKITGTHTCSSGSGTDTSDATATAEDIISGKTAYINGGKVTGTLIVQSYYTGDVEPDDSFGNDGDLYFVRGE